MRHPKTLTQQSNSSRTMHTLITIAGQHTAKKARLTTRFKILPKRLELDPDYANAYLNRGVAYGDTSDYARAIGDYIRVIELEPNNAKAYYN